jgi:transcription antitermination factor NusG
MAGNEDLVINGLKRLGYQALSPMVMKWKPENGSLIKRPARLLPGYVFFDTIGEHEPDWDRIISIPYVLRVLQYSDGGRALRASDVEFVNWLKRHEGMIDISRVVQVGTKIQFIDGPLKELSGLVVKVNKSRRQVAVYIGSDSLAKVVWCSIEYVEPEKIVDG